MQNLAFRGQTHAAIATALSICRMTLEQHFQAELDTGRAIVKADLAHSMVEAARNGDKRMLIYLSKAQMGWRESNVRLDDGAGDDKRDSNLFRISSAG